MTSVAFTDKQMTDAEDFFRIVVLQGQFDRLIRLKPHEHRVVPSLANERARVALDTLVDWLHDAGERVAITDWSRDIDSLDAVKDLFCRAGLVLEAFIERPSLVGLTRRPFDPVNDPGTSIPSVALTRLVLFPADDEDAPSRGDAFAEGYLELFKYAAVHFILLTMSRYRIFRTGLSELRTLDAELRALSNRIDVVRDGLPVFDDAHRADMTRDGFARGVRGLLALSRARVCRAIGGASIPDAEGHLAMSLEMYEERAGLETKAWHSRKQLADRAVARPSAAAAGQPRMRRHHVMAGCYRVTLVLLQQGYLNFITSQLDTARSVVKTARLLALVNGRNRVLESEIALVASSVEVALQGPVSGRDENQADDKRRRAELARVDRDLKELVKFEKAWRRPVYAYMAVFTRALCASYAGESPQTAIKFADRILYDCTRAVREESARPADGRPADRHEFWKAAAMVLKLRVWSRAAQLTTRTAAGSADSQTQVDTLLASAHDAGVEALKFIGTKEELANQRVECSAHMAQVEILLGDFEQASHHLRNAVPASTTAGYTTNPFVSLFCVLLRAEMALSSGHGRDALGYLSQFEEQTRQHYRSPALQDRYEELRRRARASANAWLITDDDLRERNSVAFDDLKEALQEYLIAGYRRVAGPRATDQWIAKQLKLDPKTVARIRGRLDDPKTDRKDR